MSRKVPPLRGPTTPVSRALVESGFTTETQTKKSMGRSFADDVLKMAGFSKRGKHLIAVGRNMTPETQEHLVRGRLAVNTIQGKDDGSQSAKSLGSDRRVNMWTLDTQIGAIILNCPQELIDKKAKMLAELQAELPARDQ